MLRAPVGTAPVWAQDAALAVEDALALADLLATGKDWSRWSSTRRGASSASSRPRDISTAVTVADLHATPPYPLLGADLNAAGMAGRQMP